MTQVLSDQVSLLEVNPTVATGEPGLLGCLGKGCPGEGDISGRSRSRLDPRGPCWQDSRRSKAVAAGKVLEDCCCAGTDSAVGRTKLRERRAYDRRKLVGEPVFSKNLLGALVGTSPGAYLFATEEVMNSCHRPLRVVGPFGIPGGYGGIEGAIGEDEKQLHITVKIVVIPLGDELPDLLATDLSGHFELLVLGYASQLYAFALRWIGNPTDAEDIVQGAFERAFITLSNYQAPYIRTINLRPWLYKVTLNVSRNYTSRTRLHTVSLTLVEDVEQLEQDEDWHSQPELVFENVERRREVEAMVATLAPCYRDAISLCYFGDLSYQEAATILNKSIGTIKFYVHRGIALLRKGQQSQMNEVR